MPELPDGSPRLGPWHLLTGIVPSPMWPGLSPHVAPHPDSVTLTPCSTGFPAKAHGARGTSSSAYGRSRCRSAWSRVHRYPEIYGEQSDPR
jgi:hypothetical protein